MPWTFGYRYVDQAEYEVITNNGMKIPNTNKFGSPKDVYTSPNKYNTVSEAVSALKIGEENPYGKYPNPKYRLEFRYENVAGIKSIGNVAGGKGIEVISSNEIKVDNVTELKSSFAAFDNRDDDFNSSNHPDGTGGGGGVFMQENGDSYYEDRFGQRRPVKYSFVYGFGEHEDSYFGAFMPSIQGPVNVFQFSLFGQYAPVIP